MSKNSNIHGRRCQRALGLLALLLCGCVSPTDDLRGLAERPPLDRAVLVSGGAFFTDGAEEQGTFRGAGEARVTEGALADGEAIAFGSMLSLQYGMVRSMQSLSDSVRGSLRWIVTRPRSSDRMSVSLAEMRTSSTLSTYR